MFNLNELLIAIYQQLCQQIGVNITLSLILAHDLWPARDDIHWVSEIVPPLIDQIRGLLPEGGSITMKTANLQRSRADIDTITLAISYISSSATPGCLDLADLEPILRRWQQQGGIITSRSDSGQHPLILHLPAAPDR